MLLTLLLLIIMGACIGFGFRGGMWGGALRLVNVVTAALVATNFFEPLADYLQTFGPSYQYFWDLIALWLIFALTAGLLTAITDALSRVKVRFPRHVDQLGTLFFSAWTGWVMICFTMMSLHTAALPRNFLGGSFQPERKMVFGLAPDRQWLAFAQRMSRGPFGRLASKEQQRNETFVFDPQGVFMLKYATRRAELEAHVARSGTVRVN